MANPYEASFSAALKSADAQNSSSNPQDPSSKSGRDYKTSWVLRRLSSYLKSYKLSLIAIFLLSAITVGSQLYIPIVVGKAIDAIIGEGQVDFTYLQTLATQLIFFIILASISWYFQGWLIAKVGSDVSFDLRQQAFHKLGTLPMSTLDKKSHGDLLARVIIDVNQISDGLLQAITQLFSGVLTILGTLFFMFSLDRYIAAIVVVLTPLSILVAALISKYSRKYFDDQQMLLGRLSAYTTQIFSHIDLVNSCGYENEAKSSFQKMNEQLNKQGERAQFISSLSNPSTRFVNKILFTCVSVVGFTSVITKFPSAITVGEVQAFLTYSNQYTKPFNEISATIAQLQGAISSGNRLFEFLDFKEEVSQESQIQAVSLKGNLDISHVDFSYISQKPVLEDISFCAKAGQKIALVGHTGCGKTTLINLLMGFYKPDSGHILLDGVDISCLSANELRGHLGMVLQDSWIFTGSVYDNISFGTPGATNKQIRKAATLAHADSFIKLLPEGYDTILKDGGANLSTGQKQLICIARIMLKNPEVLILDEATSSLDSKTETDVQNAFAQLILGKTSVVVAHRLSTITNADLILVMDKGKIIERGTHSQLMAYGGAYKKLYTTHTEQTD